MFIHIPKTGGVSFEALLRDIFGESSICPLYLEEEFITSSVSLSDFQVYQGHISYFIAEVLPKPLEIITILRDPVVRALSAYEHIKRDVMHPSHKILVEQTKNLADFSKHPLLRYQISNVQTKTLGRSISCDSLRELSQINDTYAATAADFMRFYRAIDAHNIELENAKQRLRGINFFGITERFEESWTRFLSMYGFPDFPVYRLNQTSTDIVDKRGKYTDEEIAAVRRINQLDIELYDYAVNLFNVRAQ